MDYHIETLTVWEAFESNCECPLCAIKSKMDSDYTDSYLGNAAMLPEIRVEVNKKGFCKEHFRMLYEAQARLPLALQTHTYLKAKNEKDQKLLKAFSVLCANSGCSIPFFKPKDFNDALRNILSKLEQDEKSCIICEHIEQNMLRYTDTILDLYKGNSEFKKLFKGGKGYCSPHFRLMLERAARVLNKKEQSNFIPDLINMQLSNQKRLEEETEWFTKKFDYQNKDKPWGNSRDVLPRTINKLKGLTIKTE